MTLYKNQPIEIDSEFGPCKRHASYMYEIIFRGYHDAEHPRAHYFCRINDKTLTAKNLDGIKAKIKEAKQ